jgi:hypothetical protein
MPDPVQKWLGQQSKDFDAAGLDTGKAMGQVLVKNMSRNKWFFQFRISRVLRFISICDLFTDSPS